MKRKYTSGRPISGDDDCFMKNEQFKKLYDSSSLLYVNSYVELRRAFKQIAADRLRVCATRCGQYTKFTDSDIDAICAHLQNCGYNDHVVRFVRCTLDYFNNLEKCKYKSVCESFAFGGRKKEWRHAVKDIETTFKQRMRSLTQKLQEKPPAYYTEDMRQQYQETKLRYQAFGSAVQIICELFELLYIKELPNELLLENGYMQGIEPVIIRYYVKDEGVHKRKPNIKKSRVECLGLTIALQLSLSELGTNR